MILLALLLVSPLARPCLPQAAKVDPAITRADLERTLRFLASDELRGRVVGTSDAMRAAAFLAEGLERAGVAPGGDGGTYLQAVPLTSVTFAEPPRLEGHDEVGETFAFTHGVDFELFGLPPRGRLEVKRVTQASELPAPDKGIALFVDAPSSERRTLLGESRGAGFGLVLTPGNETPGAGPTAPRPARAVGALDEQPPGVMRVHGEMLSALRDGVVAKLELASKATTVAEAAANVVGVLRGAGTAARPELARQGLVYSAHYDHIREARAPGPGGDVIMNGADDDASGCAAVMELAEALAAGPPPARTLVFFFATGEEYGLLGTNWYVDHPLVPLADTVCNLNFEMIGRADPLAGGAGKLWITGDERSNLGDAFRALGMPVVVDPRPDQHFFERSDNIAFAIRGIVGQSLSSFNLHTDYHGPDDEVERIEFDHMEAAVRAALLGARALADGSLDPAWKPGGDPSKR